MSKDHVSVFKRTVLKSEEWISEMQEELPWMDADGVYHLLRAVLQTLRDQLNTNEVAQLAAQLPLVLRGTFYECWDPKEGFRKTATKQEFLAAIKEKMGSQVKPNFDFERGVLAAINVIMKNVSPGEIADVLNSLKPSVKTLFEKRSKRVTKEVSPPT